MFTAVTNPPVEGWVVGWFSVVFSEEFEENRSPE